MVGSQKIWKKNCKHCFVDLVAAPALYLSARVILLLNRIYLIKRKSGDPKEVHFEYL